MTSGSQLELEFHKLERGQGLQSLGIRTACPDPSSGSYHPKWLCPLTFDP